MQLFSARVNLPKQSHSKHSIIDPEMYVFQNKTVIFSKMNSDPDYEYQSYHKKFERLWWWNKRWLDNVELLAEYVHHNFATSLKDLNNNIIENANDLEELKNIFVFLKDNYRNRAISKRYDAVEISQEMYLKTHISVSPINMKRGLILFGYKTKRLKCNKLESI
jgi:hypothetical protein